MATSKAGFPLLMTILFLGFITVIYNVPSNYKFASSHPTIKKKSKWPLHVAAWASQLNDNRNSCHNFVQLCWVRDVIRRTSNETLSKDLFDLSSLYKFKTHMFLDHPFFHQPNVKFHLPGKELIRKGAYILEYMRYEALLTGNVRPRLNLSANTDINGRGCGYDPFKEYSYKFNAHPQQSYVHIYVEELPLRINEQNRHMMNNLFGVVKTEKTVSRCNLSDYFRNNTYHFVCPIHEGNFRITISGSYFSIVSEDFKCKSDVWNLKTYTQMDISMARSKLVHMRGLADSTKVQCRNANDHQKGFWLKKGAIFHWVTTECYFPFVLSSSIDSCLRKKKIIMFGDSHMINRKDAIIWAYQLATKNVRYYWTLYGMHLVSNLLDVYVTYLNGTKPADVFVFNVGAHDLRGLDIVTFVATMSDIFAMLQKFMALPNPPKLIWIDNIPASLNGYHARLRSNQVVEGTNEWVNFKMREIGVDVVHAFDITITMISENRGDGVHYFYSLGPGAKRLRKVNVGGAVTSVLLHMMCPLK